MNYHFVQQENWNDCGLACLAMLIENYHQQRISIYELKTRLGSIAPTGLSFFDLIELGKKYQLMGEGFNCELAMLSQNAHQCPLILNVKNAQGASHYVILNKVDQKYFYLNDPSQNHYQLKLTYQELGTIFLNKILIFKKQGKLKSPLNFKILKIWLTQAKWQLFCLIFAAVWANFFWILSAGFIKVFSAWLANQQINWWELLTYFVYVFFGCFFDFLDQRYSLILSQKTDAKLINAFLQQSWTSTVEEKSLTQKISALKETLEFLQSFWQLIIQFFLVLIFLPILELWISWLNPVFCFWPWIFSLLVLLVKAFINNQLKRQLPQQKFENQKYSLKINNFLQQQELIKKRGLQKTFLKNVQVQQEKVAGVDGQINFKKTFIFGWEKFCSKIFYFLLLVITYFTFKIQTLDAANLIYLIVLSNYTLNLLNQLSSASLSFYFLKNNSHFLILVSQTLTRQSLVLNQVSSITFQQLKLTGHQQPDFLVSQQFSTSFFVSGDDYLMQTFFLAITKFESSTKEIKINGQDFQNFENEFFILNQHPIFLPGTLTENLFNWSSDIPSDLFQKLDPLKWLAKYGIDFSIQNLIQSLNLQQQQLINFLAAFFSSSKIFIFQNCLDKLEKNDQEKLIQLFLDLKPETFVIFSATNLKLERNFCQKLVLNPMI